MNKNLLFFIAFTFVIFNLGAQNCNLKIQGSVFDEAPNVPLAFVNIFIQELSKGTITDEDGNFELRDICPGHYHLTFSHIGCDGERMHLDIYSDTILNVLLSHTPTTFGTVLIKGKKEEFVTQPNVSVNRRAIEDNANQSLSGLLENEAGVHLLKNGSGISKPIVQGLYGNRLVILNNGIAQSGQQWGNDHSPEIDPFAADKITVLKGVSAIEYGAGNLGSVILVEPKRIENEPHLHGQVNYVFETNGRGHNLNTRLGKYTPTLAWKVSGTLKKYGDRETADYFLNNTGIEEGSLAMQLEKTVKDQLFLDFYASTFNTQLGILRGSHIGNITDLERALVSEVPFFTEPNFSYTIDAPRQKVSHHLVKTKAKYFLKNDQLIELVLAGQLNNRKEFDVRRSGRSDIPSLDIAQYTFNTELKYIHNLPANWKFKIGQQNITTDNTNNPETGILPLIPDYFSWKLGHFFTISKKLEKIDFNIGARYDYELQNVVTISRGVDVEIVRFKNKFHNYSGLLSAKFELTKTQSISWNTGYATRNPAINELYSNGLHQGVSGIEEGDENLRAETALKNTLEYQWIPNANFSFNSLIYHQKFNDYISLVPQSEIRETIRGFFPVFKYEQMDANIYGLDVSTQFTIGRSFFGTLKYSYLKGVNTVEDIPLIFMPPNSFFGSLVYRAENSLQIRKLKFEESEIEINNRYVFEQNNILAGQDFIAPPSAYNLIGLKLSANINSSRYKIRCFVKADNLLNVAYRDYLNRQRYFADDLGLSISIGLNYKF